MPSTGADASSGVVGYASYRFGSFTLDLATDVLTREGHVLALPRPCIRLLGYLVDRPGRVVPKQELIDNLWPGVSASEGVLKSAMAQVRQALGDDEDGGLYIRTFPRRGYQFVYPVSRSTAGAATWAQDASGAAQPSVVVDDSRLIGRETALAALRRAFEATAERRGAPVLLSADAGGGKTMLTRHFLRWAEGQGACVLYARFFDHSTSRLAPFVTFVDLLRSAIERQGATTSASAVGDLLQRVGGHSLVDALSDRSAAADIAGAVQPRTSLEHDFRAVAPLSRAFVTLSRERLTVLALDDLQWLKEADRDLLAHLIAESQDERLMILAIVRAEDLRDDSSAISQWLRRAGLHRRFTSVSLHPWTESECAAAVASALRIESGTRMPDVDATGLFRLTGGNPHFLMEMLRGLTPVAAASRVHGGGSASGKRVVLANATLPSTLALACAERLNRLSPPVRALIDKAAVLGDEFRASTLARVAEMPVDEVDTQLQEAVHASVLSTELVTAEEDYRFHHTVLRRVAYSRLAPRVRRDLHLRVARALEVAYREQPDRVADATSAHFEAANEPAAAVTWALRAWRAARTRWRWADATAIIERAERCATTLQQAGVALSVEESACLGFGIGERQALRGDLAGSAQTLGRAASQAEAAGQRDLQAAIMLQRAVSLASLSAYDEGSREALRAQAIWISLGNQEQADRALLQWAAAEIALGHHRQAEPAIGELLEEGHTSAVGATAAAYMVGWARALQGKTDEAHRLLERARRGYQEIDDQRGYALTLSRLHWVALARGECQRAFTLAEEACLVYRRLDDVFGEAKLQMSMGQARIEQGLYEEGLALLRMSQDSLMNIGDLHHLAETLWLMGRAQAGLGHKGEALVLLERALAEVRKIGDRDDEFRVLSDLAAVHRHRGAPAAALAAASAAAAIARDIGAQDGLGEAHIQRALALCASKRRREAVKAAERAVMALDPSGSGLRWRAHWALGQTLLALGQRSLHQRALSHLERAAALAASIVAQIDPADRDRVTSATQALGGPARDLARARQEQTEASITTDAEWPG